MPRLLNDVIRVCRASPLSRANWDPRHIYRSILPFLPPLSPILVHYNKLSDPIRILRVFSQNTVQRGDPPVSAITCTALSDGGHRIALGFDDGVVEIVDTELAITISRSAGLPKPPVWLLFIDGGHNLVIETSRGDIYIWDHFTMRRQRFSFRIDGSMVVASLSHDGSMIVRVARHSTKEWYENMYIIHITADRPAIHSLSTPSYIVPYYGTGRRFPLQRSVGFSPGGQYVGAFDTVQALVWSCTSFQLIAQWAIEDPRHWFLNTNRPFVMPPLALLSGVVITAFPEHSGSITSTSCILFGLWQRRSRFEDIGMHIISLAAAAVPVLGSENNLWFRGRLITTIPEGYCNSKCRSDKLVSWPKETLVNFSLPTSQDGTRFLLYDKEGCPVLVDISRVISAIAPDEGIANQ